MAVLSSEVIESGQSFEVGGAAGTMTPKRVVYRVTTDGYMSEEAIYAAALTATPHPVPNLYQFVGGSAYVTKVDISLQQEHEFKKWIVTVTAGDLPAGSNPGNVQQGSSLGKPPLERDPVVWIGSVTETVPLTKDKDGNPIVNSADQPFDEPLTTERDLTIIYVRKNYDAIEDITKLNKDFHATKSNSVFMGNAIGTVKYMRTEASEPVYEGTTTYYVGTTSFLVDPDGFVLQIASRGWKYYDIAKTDNAAKLINARDSEEQLVSEPVYLAANGTKLPKDDPIHFVTADVLSPADFSDFLEPEAP